MEVFLNMENHKKNLETYLSSGGDPRLGLRYKSPTLENRAKIKYLLSTLPEASKVTPGKLSEEIKSEKPRQSVDSIGEAAEKSKFLGLITQYPIELHPSYNEAFTLWLQLCSLKLQLNTISPDNEIDAYEIQTDMLRKIQRFDKCKKALDHYQEYKEVIPTKSKRDFSKMSYLELDKERRNIASNICKRRQTIVNKESELPEKGSLLYQKRLEALNKKKRELEELILDEEKILELVAGK